MAETPGYPDVTFEILWQTLVKMGFPLLEIQPRSRAVHMVGSVLARYGRDPNYISDWLHDVRLIRRSAGRLAGWLADWLARRVRLCRCHAPPALTRPLLIADCISMPVAPAAYSRSRWTRTST
eukprot:SAG22_NODE_1251_length_5005_cov_22.891154_7_plen_123_part_00